MPGLKSIVHGLARLVAALPGSQEIEGLDCCLAGNKPNRPNLLAVLIIITAFVACSAHLLYALSLTLFSTTGF